MGCGACRHKALLLGSKAEKTFCCLTFPLPGSKTNKAGKQDSLFKLFFSDAAGPCYRAQEMCIQNTPLNPSMQEVWYMKSLAPLNLHGTQTRHDCFYSVIFNQDLEDTVHIFSP